MLCTLDSGGGKGRGGGGGGGGQSGVKACLLGLEHSSITERSNILPQADFNA